MSNTLNRITAITLLALAGVLFYVLVPIAPRGNADRTLLRPAFRDRTQSILLAPGRREIGKAIPHTTQERLNLHSDGDRRNEKKHDLNSIEG